MVILTPLLAVIRPTESTLVTSSYVKVPAILTFPVNVAATPLTFPLKQSAVAIPTLIFGDPDNPVASPANVVAVRTPVEVILEGILRAAFVLD